MYSKTKHLMYKNIFIDLDDTLWDTAHNNKECLKEIYADYDMKRHYASFEAFYDIYMPHNLDLWAKYREGIIDRQTLIIERFRYVTAPIGIEKKEDVLSLNNDFLMRTTKKTKLIDGAIDLLEYLYPRYRLFILSNGFREVQSLKMENSGILKYFERIILSEDAEIQKPHKGIFDYALINTNSKRNESVMLGDSWDADIVGAYNSKIDQIWFNPKCEEPKGFVPTVTIKDLKEIIIRRIL